MTKKFFGVPLIFTTISKLIWHDDYLEVWRNLITLNMETIKKNNKEETMST